MHSNDDINLRYYWSKYRQICTEVQETYFTFGATDDINWKKIYWNMIGQKKQYNSANTQYILDK